MSTNQKNTLKKIIMALTLVPVLIFANYHISHAQTLGLSISPPIDEIMIKPGKEVTRTFTITNDGNDGMASVYIIPFRAEGENGNTFLDEKNAVTASSPYAPWFSMISPAASFGEKFYIPGGGVQQISIKISPPEQTPGKDYYFTLLYELNNEVPGSISPIGPTNQARIGANILISITEDGNPYKKVNISEFSAPLIIDSLGNLIYKIRLSNPGFYFYKSAGTITIKPLIGSSETLTLAPLNVITNSTRNISCIENETLIPCKSSQKVLVGIYKATLSIDPNDNSEPEKEEVLTVAFPFSLLVGVFIIITTYKIIKRPKDKLKNPIDKHISKANNV